MYPVLEIVAFSAILATIVVTGFILHRYPVPYPWMLFNLHKLLTVGLIVYFTIKQIHLVKQIPGHWSLNTYLIITAVFCIALLVTGAFLSQGKKQVPLLIVHKIASLALIVSIALMTYFSN
jgi:hypothetical protein